MVGIKLIGDSFHFHVAYPISVRIRMLPFVKTLQVKYRLFRLENA
jgi:hypothetical protein